MASANGLINNNLVVNTLDGLTTVYTNGGAIDPTLYVKYAGNTSNTDLGYYNLTTLGTLSGQALSIPNSATNSESFTTYTISTMGNMSTLGGLVTTETTSGNSMYFTGGVVGAKNFQFSSPGTAYAGKVVCTDGNSVMSTTINAGQLSFITGLTSQAGGVGQTNTWTGSNTFNTLTNIASLRITSSITNDDYSIAVNGSNELEFIDLTSLQKVKITSGGDVNAQRHVYAGNTVYSVDSQLTGTQYLAYGTGQQWGTTLNGSGEYEVQDNAGAMRLRMSKTTGLTVSTMNITQVPSATPTYALGVNGTGGVVSFAVPTATNLLPLNNTWTGTNQFNNRVTLNTATAQGSLTVYNTTDSLPGGGSGSALAVYSATSTDSAVVFGCASNTTFAIRSSGSLANPTLALYSPTVPNMLTLTQNEATMTHGGNSFSLGNTRFQTTTVDSGVTSASVLAVSPTTISSSSGTYTALANSTTIEWRMRILSNWIGGINYTLTMVNTNWSNVKTPIQITVQSPLGTTIGSTFASLGGTSQVSFTYPQGANGNIYIYIYYVPLGATPTFTWTTLSVVANVLRSNLYSTGSALALNTTTPSFAGFALQSSTAPNGAGNATTIENFVVGDVSAATAYPKGYSIGFNAGNLTATIACQQASNGSGTTFYNIASQAAYHSWKSQPTTANSVDMALDYNSGTGGLRLNKNGTTRTTGYLLDVAGVINGDYVLTSVGGDTTSNGYVFIQPGNATNTGYIEFRAAGTTRRGYIGYADTSQLYIQGENGSGLSFQTNGTQRLGINGTTGLITMAAAQNTTNSAQVYTSSGGTVTVAQCMMKQLYFSNSVAWGGGVNITSAFYRYSTTCPIRISGKYSGYWTFGSMGQVYLRFYSQSNGTYTYQYINTFTNNASNHVTVPLDQIFDSSLLPYLGWYDVFFASSSQFVTDSNDQLTLNVQFLPVAGF